MKYLEFKYLLIAFVVMLTGGCATTDNIKPAYVPSEVKLIQTGSSQVIHTPNINTDAEAEIGQTIVTRANLTVYPAVTVSKTTSTTIKQKALSNRWSGTININAGTFKKTGENAEGGFYADPNGMFNFAAGAVKCLCGVFVPNDSAKSPALFTYHVAMGAQGYEIGETPIEITKSTYEVWGKDSLKKELIYGGLSQKAISISYREFIDGTARPAFTQDLRYDLSEGDVIGFRGARFQVVKATNTSIKYRILKPLD